MEKLKTGKVHQDEMDKRIELTDKNIEKRKDYAMHVIKTGT
jgi:hypothetical protein